MGLLKTYLIPTSPSPFTSLTATARSIAAGVGQLTETIVWLSILAIAVLMLVILYVLRYFAGFNRGLSTRLNYAAEAVQQAQRDVLTGKLALGLTNDINNLIMLINGNTQLAVLNGTGSHANYLQQISIASERTIDLARRLLAISRGGSDSEIDRCNLRVLVNEFQQDWSTILSAEDTVVYHPIPHLFCSIAPIEFKQNLLNLLLNAQSAVAGGTGKIDVEMQLVPATLPDCYPHPVFQSCAFLSLTDNGTGIPEDRTATTFEGSMSEDALHGIGLMPIATLVERAGGAVRARNMPEGGARFEVYLPLVNCP